VAAETVFTKPVVLQGEHLSSSRVVLTTNGSGVDCFQTSNSLYAYDLTISTQTPPTTYLAACGIRADITTNTGVSVIVERCSILDFNFPVFADGRGASGNAFNIAHGVIKGCTLRTSGAASGGSSMGSSFLSGCRQATAEDNEIDNQDMGDHNLYLIRNFNNYVRNNRLKNTGATESLCAVKMVTEIAGDSGTLGLWAIEDNQCEANALPIFVSITGSIRLPKLRIVGNTIRNQRSTTSLNGAAINITASNTAVYDHIRIDDIEFSDLQLGAITFIAAAGATFRDMYVSAIRVFDFSKSSSGTYSAVVTDSSGTYENLHINGLRVVGNSTGRNAYNVGTATRCSISDVVESGCTTVSVGNGSMKPGVAVVTPLVAPNYDASIDIDAAAGSTFLIVATNNAIFTVANPTNPTSGQQIRIRIKNTSGGALGAVTWDTAFKLGAAWTSPANGYSRSIDFEYNGTNWVEATRSAADVAN
jgi:hypothetical protein